MVERPIRVLAVVSSPNDLTQHNLAPIDVARERELLKQACAPVSPERIDLDFLDAPVTLARLEQALHSGYHVLHFVGHGAFNPRTQQGAVYFQDDTGNTQIVTATRLSALLKQQQTRPHLVFLAACQTAAQSTVDALVGVGPELIQAGIPAMVAMQDRVSMNTAQKMTPIFYECLLQHGVVDRAMNEARNNLWAGGHTDAAVPVLFMRLKDGQLWRDAAGVSFEAIAAHRTALRERLAQEAQARWGGMAMYIQEEGATLPIEASPYQQGRLGPRENLMQTLHTAGRLLLLGEPGSGKTVALERLAWELCNGTQPVIPVLIRLFRYASTPLSAWVRSTLQQTGHLRFDDDRALTAFLQESPVRCVFLFDGLNEVPPDHRERLVDEITRWIDTYPRHTVILTSRVQDELWRLLRDKMTQAMVVQPISDVQAQAYLDAHLSGRGRALYRRLDQHLREITRRPLILWLIKEAGAAGESVPDNRGELYARFVSRML